MNKPCMHRYPEGTAPHLALLASCGGLAVGSNECGFTEADVRALCDIGASNKLDSGWGEQTGE